LTKIRIKSLPCDESLGGPQYERTSADTQGQRVAQDAGPPFLLSEAIRFYNYGLERPSAGLGAAGFEFTKDKSTWRALSAKTMQTAMQDLCRAYRDALVETARQLSSPGTLQQHLKEGVAQQYPLSVSANRGLLAAHLLLSPAFRRETGRPKPWLVRDFEKLEAALAGLRELISKSAIEDSLARQYGKDLPQGANVGESLFQPYWGGSWLIRAKAEYHYPGRPFYPHDAREVGATEKLHVSVISSAFVPEEIIVRSVREDLPLTDCEFLADIYQRTATVEAILPSLDSNEALKKQTACWREWHNNLRDLEQLFGQALELRLVLYGAEQRHGVRVGLPGALGLIGVLRAYIAELKARALMVALPMAIQDIYNSVNGYLGVALWEALSGEDASGVLQRGCLGWLEDQGAAGKEKLVGRLGAWRNLPLPEQDFWGTEEPVQVAARTSLRLIIPPLPGYSLVPDVPLLRAHIGFLELLDKVDTLRDFYRNFKETLPRFPAVTKDLGIARAPESDWLYGARFTAQAQLFIAHQLVERAGQILWQKPSYTTPDHNDDKFKKRRQVRNFILTAGSYWWSGRKAPHTTHRQGVNFDVCFGPDIVTWPELTDISNAWQACKKKKKIEPAHEQRIANLAAANNVAKRYIYAPVALCYSPAEYRIEQATVVPVNTSARLVYRQVLYDAVAKTRTLLAKFAQRTVEGKDPESADEMSADIKEEEDGYDAAEVRYTGTPHFMDTQEFLRAVSPTYVTELPDWQRTHATHVALVLSGAHYIVFASAIVHFRAMRAIRTAFRGRLCFPQASALVANAHFGFDPSGHYHHWHVDYPLSNVLKLFTSYFPVWIELGIDLQSFVNYLKDYPLPKKPGPALVKTLDEYQQTLAACSAYQQAKAKYEQDQGLTADSAKAKSEELLRALFLQFQAGEKLIAPTLKIGHLLGTEETGALQDARQATKTVVREIENILKEVGCVSRLKAYEEEELWDEVPWLYLT
jgi:hypothetical protein